MKKCKSDYRFCKYTLNHTNSAKKHKLRNEILYDLASRGVFVQDDVKMIERLIKDDESLKGSLAKSLKNGCELKPLVTCMLYTLLDDSVVATPMTKDELVYYINSGKALDKIDIKHITDMSGLFKYAYHIKDFKGLENWDTSNVVDMSYMFYEANNFNADLSKWDFSKVEKARYMFDGRGSDSFKKAISGTFAERDFLFYLAYEKKRRKRASSYGARYSFDWG